MPAGGGRCCWGGERCRLPGSRGVDGALAGTAAPVGSMGMSDSEKGAPWRPGSGVRQLACCSQSLREYIILLLSEGSREIHLQMAAGSSSEISDRAPGMVIVSQILARQRGRFKNVSFICSQRIF